MVQQQQLLKYAYFRHKNTERENFAVTPLEGKSNNTSSTVVL